MGGMIEPGAIIGSYRFERFIGRGSHGEVWEGRHCYLNRPVAIKVLQAHDLDIQSLQRVEQECRIGGTLNHQAHIVAVQDAFSSAEQFFIVMELLPENLAGYLHTNPRPAFGLTLTWALDLCSALKEVHGQKIIHCDLKPQNILLTETAQVKIGDFGIAHLRAARVVRTESLSTPAYQAPEQEANLPLDAGADIYALCAILFEVWSGRPHFPYRRSSGDIVCEELELLVTERYPDLSPEVRAQLVTIVVAGLRPRAERMTLTDLHTALQALQEAWQSGHLMASTTSTDWLRPDRYERLYRDFVQKAYRTFFRDRFIHQAMEIVETQPPSLKPEHSEVSADPLLFELVALLDEASPTPPESVLPALNEEEKRTVPIADLRAGLAQYHTIALLGEPGSGKTSALLWLLGHWSSDRIPVFASLNRYTTGLFEEFLSRQWYTSLVEALRVQDNTRRTELEAIVSPLSTALEDYLARGRAVLFLDALNELPRDEGYRERLTQLRHFVDTAAKQGNWIIVSCRQQDYTETLRPLQRIEIRPLDDARIQQFLMAYLGEKSYAAMWMRLADARYTQLRELVRNPFLLTALVAVSQAGERDLPTSRAVLLSRLTMVSMRREEQKRHPDRTPLREQEKVLSGIALVMTQQGRTAMAKADLVPRLPAGWCFDPSRRKSLLDNILELTSGARLIYWSPDKTGGTVAFAHQLWQEYYTAHLLSHLEDSEWLGLARHLSEYAPLKESFDLIHPHLHDPLWRNVILLTVGQLEKTSAAQLVARILHADSLWEEFLYRDALLAAVCLTESDLVHTPVAEAVLAQLQAARQLDIRPLTRLVDQARNTMLAFWNRPDDLLSLCRDKQAWWEDRLRAAETLEKMRQTQEVVAAWLVLAKDEQLGGKVRQMAAEHLEKAGQQQVAIAAWLALESDPKAGKGPRRMARQALKRLR